MPAAPLTLAAAEQAERTAFAAIGALGDREVAAVNAWIACNCEGVQPRPDAAERKRLADALSAAIAAREALQRQEAA